MFCPPKITGYTVYVVMLACNYVWPILKEQPSDTSGAPLKIEGGGSKTGEKTTLYYIVYMHRF